MTPWEPDEVEYLRTGFHNHVPVSILAEELDRSVYSVHAKLDWLGAWRRNTGQWTKEQVALIKANYRKMPVKSLARRLGRKITVGAIVQKANALGLLRSKHHASHNRPWTPDEDWQLLAMLAKGSKATDRKLQHKLKRTKDAIRNRCKLIAAKKRKARILRRR